MEAVSEQISKERLAELEALLLENAGLCAMRPDCNCTACATVRAFRELLALRELQERREREGSELAAFKRGCPIHGPCQICAAEKFAGADLKGVCIDAALPPAPQDDAATRGGDT